MPKPSRNSGFSNLYDRNRSRVRWLWTGGAIGLVIGFVLAVILLAWSTFFVDERITSAAILGVVAGAGGCWAVAVHDRDLFRSRRQLDDCRKQIAQLTRTLRAHEDWDGEGR